MHRLAIGIVVACAAVNMFASSPQAQTPAPAGKAPVHARQVRRLLIQHAMVIPGPGTPAYGPTDILVEDGVIARLGTRTPGWPEPDEIIDASTKYGMPGIVNTHMHWRRLRAAPITCPSERNLIMPGRVPTACDVLGSSENTN